MKGNILTDEAILKGMSCVGRHPLHQRHCYLECNTSGQNLEDIESLGNFPNLMYIDVSDNQITTLKSLSFIPMLVQLNASCNKLTDCLNFAPARCTIDNAWASGNNAVGSMLTLANLSYNEIELLENLSDHVFLECLLLNHNRITSTIGLKDLRLLQVLDLSYNNIKEISGLDGLFIQELALRGNQLVSLSGIENLACLTTLDVAHNKITSFEPLSACKQLNYLDASDNDLPRIRELNPLSELEWLRKLIIVHNPCCNKKFYRSRVIYRIPQLIELDSTNVSAEDKIAAMNLYSSQNGDKEMRNHVFEKYFPNEKFIDFSEHISDPED